MHDSIKDLLFVAFCFGLCLVIVVTWGVLA